MPDSMETSYNQWIGRKQTSLRRPTLDCGCRNTGEVSYHLWCDRLACQEHADALHDCGQFKGKSGSDEEAVEPEAVVEAPAPRPLTLSPESYRALYGPAEAIRHAHPLLPVRLAETWQCPRCDFSTFIGGLKRLHEVACPAPPVGELRSFFTTALDGEADAFIGHVSAALDELVEPDPDNPHQLRHWVSRERVQELWSELGMDEPGDVECCGHTTPGLLGTRLLFCTQPVDHAGDHRDDSGCSWSELPRHSDSGRWHIIGTGDQVFESPCDCPKPVPWWRRMLPGGTR